MITLALPSLLLFADLTDLEGNLSHKVYEAKTKGFHLKSYIFLNGPDGVAFVGSSNLSEPALTTSIEWNYKVVTGHDTLGFREIRDGFEVLFNSPASVPVSEDWIERYEQRRVAPTLGESAVPYEAPNGSLNHMPFNAKR